MAKLFKIAMAIMNFRTLLMVISLKLEFSLLMKLNILCMIMMNKMNNN